MPFLICRHLDKHTEWNANVDGDSFTLGCSDQSIVPLPDRELAAREAVISREGDRFKLRDLVEQDRVHLNGAVTRESLLKDGDTLQLGRVAIQFYEEVPRKSRQVTLPQAGRPPQSLLWTPSVSTAGESSARRRRSATLGVLALLAAALIAGGLVGFLGQEQGAIPRWGPVSPEEDARGGAPESEGKTASSNAGTSRAAGSEFTASGAGTSTAAVPKAEDPLEKLRRQLAGSGNDLAEAQPKEAGAHLGPDQEISVTLAVARTSDNSATSRRALHRLFLDVAGRPPTRREEGELTTLSHRDRWRFVIRVASAPQWLHSPADAFKALLGREPTLDEMAEVEKLASPEFPAAFWVAALQEYGRADRRRPRSPGQQASALIVDLTDRIPTSSAETRVVGAALKTGGQREVVTRTLVYSPRSRLPAESEGLSWWKDELFRFLLRVPTPQESEEIPRVLETWPRAERHKWFLLTLASLPGYETY